MEGALKCEALSPISMSQVKGALQVKDDELHKIAAQVQLLCESRFSPTRRDDYPSGPLGPSGPSGPCEPGRFLDA